MSEVTTTEYFGGCPRCGKVTDCLNIGRGNRFFRKEHKVTWCVGSNLFSDWRDEIEEERRRLYNEVGLDDFTEVKPIYPAEEPTGIYYRRVAKPK